MNNNELIVREAMRIVWNEGGISRVDQFYSEDFEADYPMTDWGKGRSGVRALVKKVRDELAGYNEKIIELVDGGDEITVLLSISGRQPVTKELVAFRDVSILSLQNGMIIRQRGVSDLMSLYSQLGLISLPKI